MSLSDMTCPFCGSSGILPVIYGYAPFDILVRADRGEVILGGGLCRAVSAPLEVFCLRQVHISGGG